MPRLRSFSFIVLAFLSVPAFAGSDEEEIANQMAKAAGEAFVKELGFEAGKNLIDMGFAPPPAGEPSVGATTISFVRLGLSLKEFSETESPRQKSYAAANSIAAGISVINPAAGAVASVVVLAANLVDSYLGKEHAKEFMRIQLRIQEHLEALQNTREQLAKAEFVRFSSLKGRMNEELFAINGLNRLLIAQCKKNGSASFNENEIRACLSLSARAIYRMENFLSLAERMLQFESRLFDKKEFYRLSGGDWAAEEQRIQKAKSALTKARPEADQLFSKISSLLAKRLVKKATAAGILSPIAKLRDSCYAELHRFNRAANLLLLESGEENREKMAELYANSLGLRGSCAEISLPEGDPLFAQLRIYESTKQDLRSALEQTGTDAELSEEIQ